MGHAPEEHPTNLQKANPSTPPIMAPTNGVSVPNIFELP